jgi:WD40 repeat protein
MFGHAGLVKCVAFSPTDKLLATGGQDGTVRLWSAESSLEVARLEGHANSVYDVAFARDGKWVASASFDRTTKVWRVPQLPG